MMTQVLPGNIVEYKGMQYVVHLVPTPYSGMVFISKDPYMMDLLEVDVSELTLINNGII